MPSIKQYAYALMTAMGKSLDGSSTQKLRKGTWSPISAVWDLPLEGDMISHLWQAAVWDIPLEEDMISPLWQAAVWDLLLDSLCSSNCPGVGTVGSAAQSQRTWETLSLLSIVTMMTVMCKSSIRYQHQVSPQWSIEACLVLLYYYSDNCDNHGAPPNTMWNYDLL